MITEKDAKQILEDAYHNMLKEKDTPHSEFARQVFLEGYFRGMKCAQELINGDAE